MYLKKLELKNYRNYAHIDLNFGKDTILILGDNGQGKTNLLESIYYISTGRSHRTYSQNELINWNSNYSIIRALVGSGKEDVSSDNLIELELRDDNNIKIKVDKVCYRKKSEFVSILPSVIFSPNNLRIVKASPSNRRNFLDSVLDKIYDDFFSLRLKYQKILTQRNSLIKSIGSIVNMKKNSTLEIWNDNIIKYGIKIIKKRILLMEGLRKKFIEYMNYFFPSTQVSIFYVFSWDKENLCVDNLAENIQEELVKELEREFRLQLEKNLAKDLSYKTTTIGPHRDDFVILLRGKDIRAFGSQGQQRAASISLKLGELAALKEKLKRDPILLLDDVLSELDLERKKILIKIINNKFQTFITTTNISYLNELYIDFGNKFLVKDNKISNLR